MKHLPRLVERVIVKLCSVGKRRAIALDREGKRILKKQSHRKAGYSGQKHPNDHPLPLNFSQRLAEATRKPDDCVAVSPLDWTATFLTEIKRCMRIALASSSLRSFYPILGLLFCDSLMRGVHISA